MPQSSLLPGKDLLATKPLKTLIYSSLPPNSYLPPLAVLVGRLSFLINSEILEDHLGFRFTSSFLPLLDIIIDNGLSLKTCLRLIQSSHSLRTLERRRDLCCVL